MSDATSDLATSLTPHPKEKLVSDLKLVIADTEELLRLTANEAGQTAAELRVRVKERLAQARVRLSEVQDTVVAKAKAAGQSTDAYVQENPWRAVGIAAAVGAVVGLLISRR